MANWLDNAEKENIFRERTTFERCDHQIAPNGIILIYINMYLMNKNIEYKFGQRKGLE